MTHEPRQSSDAVDFLDRQALVFSEQRRVGLARLGLHPGDSVLDAGCGPATDTFDLEDLVMPGGRVVGVDADPAMIHTAISRASERASSAEFSVADVHYLDYPDGTFDLARCVLLLLHVEDPLAVVQEMARVVMPGGQVLSIDPDHQMTAVDASDPALSERVFRGRFAALTNPRIGRQLRGLFVAAGLVDVKVEAFTEVSVSWSEFDVLRPGQPTALDIALAQGSASVSEVEDLKADLAGRDRDGRFFACSVRMRCQGTKPS